MKRSGSGETATSAEQLYQFMPRIRCAGGWMGGGSRGLRCAGMGWGGFGVVGLTGVEAALADEWRWHCSCRRCCRRAGEDVPVNELLRFSKLFSDELTLGNLERYGGAAAAAAGGGGACCCLRGHWGAGRGGAGRGGAGRGRCLRCASRCQQAAFTERSGTSAVAAAWGCLQGAAGIALPLRRHPALWHRHVPAGPPAPPPSGNQGVGVGWSPRY